MNIDHEQELSRGVILVQFRERASSGQCLILRLSVREMCFTVGYKLLELVMNLLGVKCISTVKVLICHQVPLSNKKLLEKGKLG